MRGVLKPEGPLKLSDVARNAKREEMGQQPSQGGYRPREKEPRQPLGDDEWATVAVSRGKKPSMAQTTAYTSSGGASNAFSALGKKDVKKEAPKPPKEEKPLKPAKPDKVKAEEKIGRASCRERV